MFHANIRVPASQIADAISLSIAWLVKQRGIVYNECWFHIENRYVF